MFERKGRLLGIIVMSLILIAAIIHLGVAIGVIVRDRKYGDLFTPQVGLGGYNIVVSLLAFLVGGFGLFAVLTNRGILSKIVAIVSAVLGVFAIASLITALVINSQCISYMSKRLTDDMNLYIQSPWAEGVIDTTQSNFKCCGVNLWLDWAITPLGVVSSNTNTGTTGTNTGTNTVPTGKRRRRRQQDYLFTSPLQRVLRRKRQVGWTSGSVNSVFGNIGVNMPHSCCTNGGISTANSVGAYCVSNGNNGTNSFYLNGCLQSIANVAVEQTMGIGVINCFLLVLAFGAIPTLINLYPEILTEKNVADKQPMPEQYVDGQNQNGGYSVNSVDPNFYNTNSNGAYSIYQQL